MPAKKPVRFLYTYNDGCNGQRVRGTISQQEAADVLRKWHPEYTAAEARGSVDAAIKDKQEIGIEGEIVLLPIIDDPVDINEDHN